MQASILASIADDISLARHYSITLLPLTPRVPTCSPKSSLTSSLPHHQTYLIPMQQSIFMPAKPFLLFPRPLVKDSPPWPSAVSVSVVVACFTLVGTSSTTHHGQAAVAHAPPAFQAFHKTSAIHPTTQANGKIALHEMVIRVLQHQNIQNLSN